MKDKKRDDDVTYLLIESIIKEDENKKVREAYLESRLMAVVRKWDTGDFLAGLDNEFHKIVLILLYEDMYSRFLAQPLIEDNGEVNVRLLICYIPILRKLFIEGKLISLYEFQHDDYNVMLKNISEFTGKLYKDYNSYWYSPSIRAMAHEMGAFLEERDVDLELVSIYCDNFKIEELNQRSYG